jgi:hypothetical protein
MTVMSHLSPVWHFNVKSGVFIIYVSRGMQDYIF